MEDSKSVLKRSLELFNLNVSQAAQMFIFTPTQKSKTYLTPAGLFILVVLVEDLGVKTFYRGYKRLVSEVERAGWTCVGGRSVLKCFYKC